MTIIINNEDIRIRPSAIENFYGCAYQWGKTFLEGSSSIPNSRAAIGTSIHAGVEAMWTEAMSVGKKVPNVAMMTDAAVEAWKEEASDGMRYGEGENEGSCHVEIIKGTQAFVEDIVPFTAIPTGVEEFFEVPLKHAFVSSIGGTVDYITNDTIADVKTTKRKSGPEGHTVQQSVYKYLANANGRNIKHNLIQQVVLTKTPSASIQMLEADIDQSKYLINTMLDVLDLVHKDVAPIETLLRPNPKHMFCSHKFCAHHSTCPAIKGNLAPKAEVGKVKL